LAYTPTPQPLGIYTKPGSQPRFLGNEVAI
jgi:hypothetical protein